MAYLMCTNSDHHRAYEVAGQLVEHVDTADKLIDLQKDEGVRCRR